MAREGRACRDRQREGRACRDRQREGRAPARPETAWGKRTSRSLSLPTTYIFYTSTRPRPFPTTARRRRHNAPRRRGRTPLATACVAHFVRGICRHYTLPPTFLHFYTAKAIPHDGEGAVATMPHDGEAHPSSDRLRGSLRSGDMSPRMGGRNKCDPPAFLPKSISKWPNAIVNRKSQIANP